MSFFPISLSKYISYMPSIYPFRDEVIVQDFPDVDRVVRVVGGMFFRALLPFSLFLVLLAGSFLASSFFSDSAFDFDLVSSFLSACLPSSFYFVSASHKDICVQYGSHLLVFFGLLWRWGFLFGSRRLALVPCFSFFLFRLNCVSARQS